MRKAVRLLALAFGFALMLPVFAWVGLNVWLNVGLPYLVNKKPEKLHLDYTMAWMLWPGTVEVYGLDVRSQGPKDQWMLHVGTATAYIDLQSLRSQTIRLSNVTGKNASFRYRKRLPDGAVMGPEAPPIPGFENPPLLKPEEMYTKGVKWDIVIEDAEVEDLDEVWVEGYRYAGDGAVLGSVSVGSALIVADLDITLEGGELFRGETALTSEMNGQFAFELEGLEPKTAMNAATLDLFKIRADLDTRISNFDFLDYYLEKTPWLRLDGTGKVGVHAGLYQGNLTEGSTFRVETEDLAVNFLGYRVNGDAVIAGEVAAKEDGELESHVKLQYGSFGIAEADTPPMVTGAGFSVDARSPDHALDQPFTAMSLVVDIPESSVPDFARFQGYMPVGVGFAVLGGSGKVRGNMRAEVPSDIARGDLYLDGNGIRANFDGLLLDADIGIQAHLEKGSLTERRYDFAGSNLSIHRFEMVDPAVPGPKLVGESNWSAKVWARKGLARIGAETYLDTDISLTCTNSVPFVAIVARNKPLAGWVQKLLSIPDVEGSARLSLGLDSVYIRGLEIRGGQMEVLLDWLRKKKDNTATLFARFGVLSLGVGVDGTERTIHVFKAREWHAERTGQAPAILPIADGIEKEERERPRKELREAKKARRQQGG